MVLCLAALAAATVELTAAAVTFSAGCRPLPASTVLLVA
jgi:hypothetical protein